MLTYLEMKHPDVLDYFHITYISQECGEGEGSLEPDRPRIAGD